MTDLSELIERLKAATGPEAKPVNDLSKAQAALAAIAAERDEAWNNGYAARDGVVDACRSQVQRLADENEALRKVVSECASALPNGAFVHQSASLEFMAKLPGEVKSVSDRQEARIKALEEAAEKAEVALCDWLNTYAPDMCDPARVAEAEARIGAQGTIAYIADVLQMVRAALSQGGGE
jgi:hypothetical protein